MGMIEDIKKQVAQAVSEGTVCTPLPEDEYTDMAFPSLIKLMKFRTDRYALEGFGRLMVMHTTTKMGMELLTLSFMPSNGLNVPYLLIDAMSMKKKRCVFVEYYGCGNTDLVSGALEELYESLRAAAVNHDVANDHSVVVQPNVVEVVHGILETTPLSVLIKTCLRYIQVAKTSFTVRLAIPEVPCSLLDVEVFEFA